MPASAPRPPIRCIWRSWAQRSSRSNLPLAILAASFSASSTWIVSAARSTRLTTSPMPRIRPATRSGWKASSLSSASPTPANLIGLPVTARMRERSAAARIAVHPGQDDAGEVDLGGEALGDVDRVLAGQRVDDEQGLGRVRRRRDRLHLAHQLVVDVETARGVEQDDVIALQLGRLERAPGDLDRLLAGDDRKRVDIRLAPEHRQLLLRRRTSDVERRHQHRLRSRSVRRLASLAVVVVLPEP